MRTQAVLLTGGASTRLGKDKAAIVIGGKSLAERTAEVFDTIGIPVTVLGRSPVPGRPFVQDQVEFEGPAVALSRFQPTAERVFVCSCDLPELRPECVTPIVAALQDKDAAIPTLEGIPQTLCAAYAAHVFEEWRHMVDADDARSMRELVRVLDCSYLDEQWLATNGIEPLWLRGVNTPQDADRAGIDLRRT